MDLVAPLVPGLGWTILLFLGGSVVATVCAFAAGLARLSHDPIVRGTARAYVELFRGSGLLVTLYWFAFAFPVLIGVQLPNLAVGIVVLGLNVGSYGAEVVRGAIQAVPRGQIEAATALNLTAGQRMRHVILPQAMVAMLPPFGNLLIELLKGTALVSMIFITDLTRAATFVRDHTGRPAAVFGIVLAIYFVLSLGITACVRWTEKRAAGSWR